MQLREYMEKNKITNEELARAVDYSTSYINILRTTKNKHVPSKRLAKLIEEFTGGLVTREDFMKKDG